jgi:BirA family transcriptional regulator, biotin operon repressor / biotin---[acetyl-CoA-carboxylase] ligase
MGHAVMSRYQIIEFSELDSTNRYACANLRELDDGDVVHAIVQSAGYGRMCRRWISDIPGNLCMSIVLKPDHAAPADLPLANLSQLMALCVCRALDVHGVSASLKWPNDILVGGRKIAGLLAETVVEGAEFLGLVLGLGVNLNLNDAMLKSIDQPATSLAALTAKSVNVSDFRNAVLVDFFEHCDAFLVSGFGMIRKEYLARCPFIGQQVRVRRGTETICGMARDLTVNGALELSTGDDMTRAVDLGEMF